MRWRPSGTENGRRFPTAAGLEEPLLNLVIVRVLERDGYRIESLMFESRRVSSRLI